MTVPAAIRIALGAVVLDTPDSSGCYFAEDAVGGWSYLITDQDGDYRFRGDGSCPGGLDAALRWAFLAAASQMPECRQIKLLLANRQTHAVMVRLARVDELVTAAIAGRGLTLLTRPDDRSVHRAMAAAEQAAAVVLRERARSERREIAMAASQQWAAARQRTRAKQRTAPKSATAQESATAQAATGRVGKPIGMGTWRAGLAERSLQPTTRHAHAQVTAGAKVAAMSQVTADPPQAGRLASMVMPLMNGLCDRLADAGLTGLRRRRRGNPVIASWMKDFDTQVATVKSHLEGVGA